MTRRSCVFIEQPRRLQQGIPIRRIGFLYGNTGDRAQLLNVHGSLGRNEAYTGYDNQSGRNSRRSGTEGLGVRQLAPKVQAADEAVDFADVAAPWRSFTASSKLAFSRSSIIDRGPPTLAGDSNKTRHDEIMEHCKPRYTRDSMLRP